MPEPRFHERRATAVMLVVISGMMILGLSLILQVVAWEIRPLLAARFGWTTTAELPTVTAAFADAFGYRPDGYLSAVVIWFFWPFVIALGHCHFRYRDPKEFANAFLFWFVCCWLLVGFGVILMLAINALSFVILVAELRPTPPLRVITLVSPISWALPFLVLLFISWEKYRSRYE
ncbi:MAG: hypothetical protein HUJ26_00030 [Planctomycetaceae bacterium]|nr:hypothetical protein [Planctomycetaceae bacterium]